MLTVMSEVAGGLSAVSVGATQGQSHWRMRMISNLDIPRWDGRK